VIKALTGTPGAATLPVVAAERLSDGLAVLILLAISIGMLSAVAYWPVVIVSLLLMALLIVILQVAAPVSVAAGTGCPSAPDPAAGPAAVRFLRQQLRDRPLAQPVRGGSGWGRSRISWTAWAWF
jgi:hypothetical protein